MQCILPCRHLDQHARFLGNNFLWISECRDELQIVHLACLFPFQKQWLQRLPQHLPSKTCLGALRGSPNLILHGMQGH